MRGEQRISMSLIGNFLKVYSSIFDFLQWYASHLSISSSLIFQFLSVCEALYCNLMRPANCKEMRIITPTRTQARLQAAWGIFCVWGNTSLTGKVTGTRSRLRLYMVLSIFFLLHQSSIQATDGVQMHAGKDMQIHIHHNADVVVTEQSLDYLRVDTFCVFCKARAAR